MADALIYLTYLGVILLIGLITTALSNWLKVSNVFFLILIGMGISELEYNSMQLISFDSAFITSIALLALILIVFDSTSRLDLKEFSHFSVSSLKLIIITVVLTLAVVGFFTSLITGVSLGVAVLFASLIVGTSPDIVFAIFKDSKNAVVQIIEIESILNTPLTVLLPFIILDIVKNVQSGLIFTQFIDQVVPFLQQIVGGIGSGILVAIVVFKIMHRWYSQKLSPLIMLTAALLAYVLAENLKTAGDVVGGNGILAVTTLGLFWGATHLRHQEEIATFSALLSNALEILVFVLIGLLIDIPFSFNFFISSFGLFIIYLMVRYFSIQITFPHAFNLKEKLFVGLNASKGIAVAVVALILTTITSLPGVDVITDLVVMFMLYSIVVSSIIGRFAKYFVSGKRKIEVGL